MICTAHHIFSGDKIEKNEMGGECSAYWGKDRCIQGFGEEAGGKETTWKTQSQMEGFNIKLDLQQVVCGSMGWIGMNQDKYRWQVASTCEGGNEVSGFIKCWEFLVQLRTGQLLKKDCAAYSK